MCIRDRGKDAQHNGALIVTEGRVVFYRKGLFGEVIEAIPLKSLSSIDRKSTMGFRTIRLHTSNDQIEFKTSNKSGEQLVVDAIESGRIVTNTSSNESGSLDDSLEKLKKLGELKESGVLTQEEFDDKKRQLLSEV